MSGAALAFVESNTTGTGRLFARAARRLGLRPVLLTDSPERYPDITEDGVEAHLAATGDRAAVLEACRWLRDGPGLAGVASSSEYYAATAAAAARELGLPAADADAIEACRDKGLQRRALSRAGVGCPAFRVVASAEEAAAAAAELGPEVVVKPVSGSGSLGVRACSGPDEARAHAAALLARGHNERGLPVPQRVLVEELVRGPEFSVETFGGQVVGVTQKHLGGPPFFVEVGHDFPAPIPAGAAAALAEEALRALAALGLGWGPAHTEARHTTSGVKIIEVNARLAGGLIPELVRLATGVDLVSATVALAAGGQPDLRPTRAGRASIRFLLPPREGLLVAADGLTEAARRPGVVEARLSVAPGTEVRLRGDFRDRIGHVIAAGEESERASEEAEAASASVRLRVEAGPVRERPPGPP
jgi:argininosuccinate lyase